MNAITAALLFGGGGSLSDVLFNNVTCVVDGVAHVVVNPNQTESATHTLQKLKIGSTQYKLTGSAEAFTNYQSLITAFNSLAAGVYDVGQSLFIQTLDVPDCWVSANAETTSVQYTYTTDAQFVADMQTAGGVQVGYYRIAQLEGEKIDLTNYVQKTDYATTAAAGLMTAADKTKLDSMSPTTVKTTLDSPLQDDVIYNLGSVSSLSLALPTSGVTPAQAIIVRFTASVAFTVSIAGTIAGESAPTVVSGKTYELVFTGNTATGWWLSSRYC